MNAPITIPNYDCYSRTLSPKIEKSNEVTQRPRCSTAKKLAQDEPNSNNNTAISARKCEIIEPPETFISKTKKLLSGIPLLLCIPFRIFTTLLNVGIFAGYYVTVITITGVAALTGALAGIASKIKSRMSSEPSQRSIHDYSINYAQNTFELLTLPYRKLPAKLKGSIFPVISGVTLFLLETAAIPGKRIPIGAYETVCAKVYQATKPYKPVTDITVRIFEETQNAIRKQ